MPKKKDQAIQNSEPQGRFPFEKIPEFLKQFKFAKKEIARLNKESKNSESMKTAETYKGMRFRPRNPGRHSVRRF